MSRDELRSWGGRELLFALVALCVVFALVVVALLDWAAA